MPLSHSDTSLPLPVCIRLEWLLSLLRMEHFNHKQGLFDQPTRWKALLMRSLRRSASESPNYQEVNCTQKQIGLQCIL
jgi:hypothetical protein